jgi:hypothetical protein
VDVGRIEPEDRKSPAGLCERRTGLLDAGGGLRDNRLRGENVLRCDGIVLKEVRGTFVIGCDLSWTEDACVTAACAER